MSIDEGIALIQNPSALKGIVELEKIFTNIFSRQELKEALKFNGFDVEKAAQYLQDLVPENSEFIDQNISDIRSKVISHEFEFNELPQ